MLHSTNSIINDQQTVIIPFNETQQRINNHRQATGANNLTRNRELPSNATQSAALNIKRSPSEANLLSQNFASNNSDNMLHDNSNTIVTLPLIDYSISNGNPLNTLSNSSRYSKTSPFIVMDPLEIQQAFSHDQNYLLQYQQYHQQMQQQAFPLMEHYTNQTQLHGISSSDDEELTAAAAAATWNNNFAAMHWMATYNVNGVNLGLPTVSNSSGSLTSQPRTQNIQPTVDALASIRYEHQLQNVRSRDFNVEQTPTTTALVVPLNLTTNGSEINSNLDGSKSVLSENISYRNL